MKTSVRLHRPELRRLDEELQKTGVETPAAHEQTGEARQSMAAIGGIFTVGSGVLLALLISGREAHAWPALIALGLLVFFLLGVGVPFLLTALDSDYWRQEREKEWRERTESRHKYSELED